MIALDGGGAEADAAAQACDASLLLTGDSGAASCAACQSAHCATDMALCASDCVCSMAVMCLQQNDNSYSLCQNAIDALSNGNVALMNLAGCTAMDCMNTPCFPGSVVADSGGQ